MKKLFAVLGIGAALAVGLPAQGQTNSAPQSFMATVGSWLTSQNPDNAYGTNDGGSVLVGVDMQNNVNVSGSFLASHTIYKSVFADGLIRNVGVGGSVLSSQGDVGLHFDIGDVRLSAGAGGGYSLLQKGGFADVFGQAEKKMTARTVLGIRLEYDIQFKQQKDNFPIVSLYTGFTF